MEQIDKLYKVNLRGMTYATTGMTYGVSYVIAENPTEAYDKVRKYLDTNDIGFSKDRELHSIELIASDSPYNDIGTLLFL